ncbi:hypothetical protein PMZ80_008504 [Knufia obscura]|uniref:Uncharacterized protein n=2 Tax=Knufia TaxID=430999 RepID=A0AAN8EL23_9EURO|nr:hypothetical protein PMZ80_008504 [Knufia obscura]KAK5951960.1 hypothetical protein OHC33_006846 [Knufia fluminis]
MELLRRMSTKPDPIDEEQIRQLSQQRRKSSFAVTALEDDLVLPAAIYPPIEVFPSSTSIQQETLLISPDHVAKGFVITYARSGIHLLTAATPSTSLPGPSHTRHFYGTLKQNGRMIRKSSSSSNTSNNEDASKKLCTLTRDVISFRKRHHVDDLYNNRRLLEMEFSTSSWDTNHLKASIEILNRYSEGSPMEPVRLKWRGRKASLEGVLEWKEKPVAVCAKGEETEDGEYVLYVAPGMDLYISSIIVMAVDDRTRRGSEDGGRASSFQGGRRDSEVVQ